MQNNCKKCDDTGFIDRTGPLLRPAGMSEPAWKFWSVALEYSDFCSCPAGRELLGVFRLESDPPECSAANCNKPAVFRLRGEAPLCENHETAGTKFKISDVESLMKVQNIGK